jgi:PhzF family phenazine biosynthesis protein
MNVRVMKVNSFTESLQGGNPAGVLLDAPLLLDEQMKQISKELKVSETAFVFPSNIADFKVRFFTPTVEVDLCGHATIAAFFSMALKGKLSVEKQITVTQETNAGILPVDVFYGVDEKIDRIMMTQARPIYKNIHFNISSIAEALQIDVKEIDDSLPEQIVSTGLFTIPICVRSLDVLMHMKPDFNKVKNLCEMFVTGSIHVFTFDTIEPHSTYHARNFAPALGINEDPVTGTANGAVCSYLVAHNKIKAKTMICEQGDFIGRPGRVFVEIDNEMVKVGGKARIAQEKDLDV